MAGIPADFNPEEATNFEEIEQQWSVVTVEHLEAYQKLMTSFPPSQLRLTKVDSEIHADFLSTFPELAPLPHPSEDSKITQEEYEKSLGPLTKLDENEMKSKHGKEKWRNFIMKYEKLVPDYNFGTILRQDATREYAEDNSILVTRTQFLAIEISRNRAGINDKLYHEAQAAKKAQSS